MQNTNTSILVPVDFTPESIHALHYAHHIASLLGLGITIAHIHEPLLDPITGTAFDVDMADHAKKSLDDLFVEIGWKYHSDSNRVLIETYFDSGDIKPRLLELAQQPKFKLIIMSSRTEDIFTKRMMGSVSMHIGKQSIKPVLIVPHNAMMAFPKKIIVGLSEEVLEDSALDQLFDFVSTHPVEIFFTHVTDDESSYNAVKSHLIRKLAAANTDMNTVTIQSISKGDQDVEDRLLSIVADIKADMLVLVTAHRNFFESLLHRSISGKAIVHPTIPVMIIHNQQNAGSEISEQFYNLIKQG